MTVLRNEDISRQIKIGLGRAVLQIERSPRTAYRRILLKSCGQHLSWDRQMDGSRARYTLDLIKKLDDTNNYRTAIRRALKGLNYATNHHDVSHVLELAILLALEGEHEFREDLLRLFRRFTDLNDYEPVKAAVRLETPERLTSLLGLLENEDDQAWMVCRRAIQEFHGEQTLTRLGTAFPKLTPTDVLLEPRKYASEPSSYQELKAIVAMFRDPSVNYEQWGSQASQIDLELAAQDLALQDDPSKLFYYLRIFRDRPFPGSPATLMKIATGEHREELAGSAALNALQAVGGAEVREFALEQIKRGFRRGNMLQLLGKHLNGGDWELIFDLLQAPRCDHGEYHSRVCSMLDIAGHSFHRITPDCLLQAYELVPCAHCRGTIFKTLQLHDAVPDWLVEEMRWDSSLHNRALAH